MLAIAWREAPADIRIAESLARLVAARASAEIERRHLESTVRKLAALPAADPHPVLEFSGDGVLRFHNDAAIRLARSLGKDDPIYILPRDTTDLVKTCLATGRNGLIFDSIGGDRTIVWSFVPIVRSASVFARAFELSLFLNLHEEMKDRGGRARSPGPSAVGSTLDGEMAVAVAPAVRLLAHDRALGVRHVAGADEAGRCCLAGPLVAAAVCFDTERDIDDALEGLDDSKRINAECREQVASAIVGCACSIAVMVVPAAEIDRFGLHRSNLRALADALAALGDLPGERLSDGFALGEAAPPHRAIPGGDRTSAVYWPHGAY